MNIQTRLFGKNYLISLFVMGLVPIFLLIIYALYASVQALFRYDKAYFSELHIKTYNSPSTVAITLETVLRTGDQSIFNELTGLNNKLPAPTPNRNLRLIYLLDVDKAGYFHYLYYDVKTYRRALYYVKQVGGRWVVVPQDAYFYIDSGQWKVVFTPLAVIWWSLLLVIGIGITVYRGAARAREVIFHLPR